MAFVFFECNLLEDTETAMTQVLDDLNGDTENELSLSGHSISMSKDGRRMVFRGLNAVINLPALIVSPLRILQQPLEMFPV